MLTEWDSPVQILKTLLKEKESLGEAEIEGVLRFYQLVLDENQVQNLTRLTAPRNFYLGHVLDVLEFLRVWTPRDDQPILDLGSGLGVPGLLAALLDSRKSWILAESERRKAEFLKKAVIQLKVEDRVEVASVRAEDYLRINSVNIIIARAVGPVGRIYAWLQRISTWNTLILFKGPSWDEEWEQFKKTKDGKKLSLRSIHDYQIEEKNRKIVILNRVYSSLGNVLGSGI